MATLKAFLQSPRTALGVLAGYFLMHVLLRSLISSSLQTDEAEQSLVTQVWLWGYGSQPPLYTWLQIPLFAILGVSVFALASLKNLLLFSIYLFTWLSAREIFREAIHAMLATFSLLLIVLFAWESQRDQTHLVLATAIAAATVFVTLRLFKTHRAGWYCLLGGLAGLGMLAKYNYAMVIVSLLLAGWSLPPCRRALRNRKILLTLACFLLVVAPHAHWAWTNPTLVFSQSNKFEIPRSGDFLLASLKGAGRLVKRIGEFVVGPALVYGVLLIRSRKLSPSGVDHLPVTLIQRTMLIGLLLCFIVVLAFHVTMIRARWLQPLLISLPLVITAWAQPRLDANRIKAVFALAGLVMLAVPTALYGTVAAARWLGEPTNLNVPYRALAAQLRAAGFTRGVIVADGHLVAGNLRPCFPESTVLAAWNVRVPVPAQNQVPVLLVWRPTGKARISDSLLKYAVREFQLDPDQLHPQTVSAPALYAPGKLESLCFALFPSRGTKTERPVSQGSAMQ
jgi:lipopolysaccharide core galacturonosyltransferase RgtB